MLGLCAGAARRLKAMLGRVLILLSFALILSFLVLTFFLCLFAVPVSIRGLYRLHLRRKRTRLGLCVGCGYDIRRPTKPRCPECGRPFDA